MIGYFSKEFFSLLGGLEFIPAASATTKGDLYVPGTYTKFSSSFPFDEIYRRLLFSLSGVLFPRE